MVRRTFCHGITRKKHGKKTQSSTGTKFPISGIQAFSVCFYEYLVLTVYDVVMSHLCARRCSLKIRILWSRACRWPCAYPGSAAIADGLTLSSSSEPGGRCASFRLQITGFWVSCRPSCRPNGQDDGRHDGRHENPEKAYKSWFFLFG